MWIVHATATLVTLAMAASVGLVCVLREAEWRSQQGGSAALELHMEGDRGAGGNNSTDAISGVSIRGIYKFTTQSEKQPMLATAIMAATPSVVSEPGRPSTPHWFTLPSAGKIPDNTTSEYELSAVAAKLNGSSSGVRALSGKEANDPNPGLSQTTGRGSSRPTQGPAKAS